MDKSEFFSQFRFKLGRAGFVGVEREQFTTDLSGAIVPSSPAYIQALAGLPRIDRVDFGFELSACQIESKVGPTTLADLPSLLEQAEKRLEHVDRQLGHRRVNLEVAPIDMPLDIYPDPTGRYQQITRNMPAETLRAACRVAATHVHVGVRNIEHAIDAFNAAIEHVEELIRDGDGSGGERIALYKTMAKEFTPRRIESADDFFERACSAGYEHDPRSCWTIVRISVHGTIEFRMFGATDSREKIIEWASKCHTICH